MPAPQSAPLLRGKLRPNSFSGEVCLRDLSNLTGGLRFRYTDMREVDGASPPLKARGDTFEILRICPTDHSGTGRILSILKGPRLPDLHSGVFLCVIPFVLLAFSRVCCPQSHRPHSMMSSFYPRTGASPHWMPGYYMIPCSGWCGICARSGDSLWFLVWKFEAVTGRNSQGG